MEKFLLQICSNPQNHDITSYCFEPPCFKVVCAPVIESGTISLGAAFREACSAPKLCVLIFEIALCTILNVWD